MQVSGNEGNFTSNVHSEEYSEEATIYHCDKKIVQFNDFSDLNQPVCASKYEWERVLHEPNMDLYRRSADASEESSFDTYQIRTVFKKVSATEICKYFWDIKYRLEWEVSLDKPPNVLSKPKENVWILQQYFRPYWPAKQRYSVFWTEMRKLSTNGENAINKACVVNKSVNYPLTDEKMSKECSKLVFLGIDVIMICSTRKVPNKTKDTVQRDDLVTDVLYICRLDPGGWAPVAAARMACKKEYPRFVKKLEKFVTEKCAKQPIEF